jgi:acyl-CoA hydrolase/GNAT superfamily N-acetyltransferase
VTLFVDSRNRQKSNGAMATMSLKDWQSRVGTPQRVIKKIRPGMSIFLGTAVAEPRTMVRHLMTSDARNLEDLELIQVVSVGDAVSLQKLQTQNFRLKTFFPGWVADEAIEEGRVDLIPSRFVKIAQRIESLLRPIDVAIVQITPPNEAGFCSLGIAVDVAQEALEQASIRVGEINTQIPCTFGDTFVQATEFDFLVEATDPPIYFDRWEIDSTWDQVAKHVASLIEDESCLAFSIGPLYEALAKRLTDKCDLGIHSPIFTDPLMDLMIAGTATNRRKETFRGKALTSYAFGTQELMAWLDNNPLVEFQRISRAFNPLVIGSNPRFVNVVAARKVDLYGRMGLYSGKGNVAAGPAEVMDFLNAAELSDGGRSIFALTSRDSADSPNVLLSIGDLPNQFSAIESVGAVVTEYGIAFLEGRTLRERAQALIDIAHPEDRAALVDAAKERKILYRDQIFLAHSARLYPSDINATQTIKNDVVVRYRPIRPSDEEGMRHLFYRFSDESVYARYFHSISSMPHAKMQEYVNVDWNLVMSIVGLIGEEGKGRIIAEARYIRIPDHPLAETVFVVDEEYQRLGIASFLYRMLIRLAMERGIRGFTAEVLASNRGMMKVFHKGPVPVKAHLENGVYHLEIPFDERYKTECIC